MNIILNYVTGDFFKIRQSKLRTFICTNDRFSRQKCTEAQPFLQDSTGNNDKIRRYFNIRQHFRVQIRIKTSSHITLLHSSDRTLKKKTFKTLDF